VGACFSPTLEEVGISEAPEYRVIRGVGEAKYHNYIYQDRHEIYQVISESKERISKRAGPNLS
jgi:hypothetical protein